MDPEVLDRSMGMWYVVVGTLQPTLFNPTYGKARAAHEAGERVGALQGVIDLCGSHTWLELLSPHRSVTCLSSHKVQQAKSCCWVQLAMPVTHGW